MKKILLMLAVGVCFNAPAMEEKVKTHYLNEHKTYFIEYVEKNSKAEIIKFSHVPSSLLSDIDLFCLSITLGLVPKPQELYTAANDNANITTVLNSLHATLKKEGASSIFLDRNSLPNSQPSSTETLNYFLRLGYKLTEDSKGLEKEL